MFKSKFNLYNSEWLELVFSERNKSYGAYDLRQHYNGNLLKALFITVTLFTALLVIPSLLLKRQQDLTTVPKHERETLIHLSDFKQPPPEVSAAKKQPKHNQQQHRPRQKRHHRK